MHKFRLTFIGLLLVISTVYVGCRSFEPIQTAPPEPASHAADDSVGEDMTQTVDLHFTTGDSELPDRVTELQFRIPRITLVRADSTRDVRELPHATVTISRGGEKTYALLRTSIDPAKYDHMEINLQDIYVTYGPNAGGPLTIEDNPIRVPLPEEIDRTNSPLILQLTLDVDRSLRRGYNGRWSFSPHITAEMRQTASTAQTTPDGG